MYNIYYIRKFEQNANILSPTYKYSPPPKMFMVPSGHHRIHLYSWISPFCFEKFCTSLVNTVPELCMHSLVTHCVNNVIILRHLCFIIEMLAARLRSNFNSARQQRCYCALQMFASGPVLYEIFTIPYNSIHATRYWVRLH